MKLSVLAITLATALIAERSDAGDVTSAWRMYGDDDRVNAGGYGNVITAGARLIGLMPGEVTYGSAAGRLGIPDAPEPDEFPGTDRVYVGAFSYAGGDDYCLSPYRSNEIHSLLLDYSSLVPEGFEAGTLTLGLAADNFQYPVFRNRYTALVNGVPDPVLSGELNKMGAYVEGIYFLSIGIARELLTPDHVLTLTIIQDPSMADGQAPLGDGWALDFLTVGVEAVTVPAPGVGAAAWLLACLQCRRRRRSVNP